MKRMAAIGYHLYIVLFALMLALPLLCSNEVGQVSVIENKTNAGLSSLVGFDGLLDPRLPMALDRFITDNIGLKEEGILTHISLMYNLFHHISITNFLEGQDGNIFYITPQIREIYQGLDVPTEEALQQNEASLATLADTVHRLGAEFVFMPIPNKEQVYSEYMPKEIRIISENSFLRTLKTRLIANGTVNTVDTEQALLNAKQNGSEMLYFRNYDASHWNSKGMLVGYMELMKCLQSQDNSLVALTQEELVVSKSVIHQPFNNLAAYPSIQKAFSSLPDDTLYTITPVNGFSALSDNSVPAEFSLAGNMQNLYFHYQNVVAKNQKTLLVYGDSYVYLLMLPLLGETFSDVYFLSYGHDSSKIEELLHYITPDYVVFECVAREVSASHLPDLSSRIQKGVDAKYHKQDFIELPILADPPIMGFDSTSIQAEHVVRLSDFPNELNLTGWAVDTTTDTSASQICIQVGDTILLTETVKRPDLGQERYLNAGFSVTVPRTVLESAAAVEVYAVTADGTAKLSPVVLEIVP